MPGRAPKEGVRWPPSRRVREMVKAQPLGRPVVPLGCLLAGDTGRFRVKVEGFDRKFGEMSSGAEYHFGRRSRVGSSF
jgi:hypothetical protein